MVTVFALIALICFILALLHVSIGTISLTVLGFCFIALHLMWGWTPWRRPPG